MLNSEVFIEILQSVLSFIKPAEYYHPNER